MGLFTNNIYNITLMALNGFKIILTTILVKSF